MRGGQKFPASPLGRCITVRAIHELGLLDLFRNRVVGFSIIDLFVDPPILGRGVLR